MIELIWTIGFMFTIGLLGSNEEGLDHFKLVIICLLFWPFNIGVVIRAYFNEN